MKFYHYISRAKVEMLLPQVGRKKFSFKITPKIEVAGVSLTAETEKRDDPALVKKLEELVDALDKQRAISDFIMSNALRAGKIMRSTSTWQHGLFYFKGGVPTFWGGGGGEHLAVVTATYLVWKVLENSIILLVGSPNNVLGDRFAPEGIFMPGTSGVEDAVRTLVTALQTDEQPLIKDGFRQELSLPGVQLGSNNRYTGGYGRELIPLPGFDKKRFPLSLAQFCLGYLNRLPEAGLEVVFRINSTYETGESSFIVDLDRIAAHDLEQTRRWSPDDSEYLSRCKERWDRAREAALLAGLGNYSKVHLGSPIYTALLGA